MESGALNGILFSTSYMFEKFANWTPIHVGTCFVWSSLQHSNCDILVFMYSQKLIQKRIIPI